MKKNILHIVNIYFVLPYFIGDQFLYLKNEGYNLNVICSPSEHLKDYAQKMKFNFSEIEISRKINVYNDIKALLHICYYIKKNNINIVVGHTPKGALLAMLASSIMRVQKRIYFRHGLVYETMNGTKRQFMILLDKITAYCATKIVCVSPSVYKKSIEEKLNPEIKQIILGKGTCGGIDALDKFNPEKINSKKLKFLKKSIGLNINTYVIGYCGRLVKDKGIIELVEAFKQLVIKTKLDIKLLLIGDFETRDILPPNIIKEITNNKHIIKTGFIYNDIQYYYALMNLYILPSYREGFPISVLEASAMKIPVLTTKVTGCIDSIIENRTGIYISNSPANILNTIYNLINQKGSDKKLKQMGEKGREFVLKNFENHIIWPIIKEKIYT